MYRKELFFCSSSNTFFLAGTSAILHMVTGVATKVTVAICSRDQPKVRFGDDQKHTACIDLHRAESPCELSTARYQVASGRRRTIRHQGKARFCSLWKGTGDRCIDSIIAHEMANAAKTCTYYCAFSSDTSVGLTSNANR